MYKLKDIASRIEGEVYGNGDKEVSDLTTPEDIRNGSIAFIKDKKVFNSLKGKNYDASLVVPFKPNPADERSNNFDYIVVDPASKDRAFIKLLEMFADEDDTITGMSPSALIEDKSLIHDTASVGANTVVKKNVKIGKNSSIGENCYIGKNTVIGDNCRIYPGVKIYPNTIIGDNVIIHSGVVIGSDGFGYSQIDGLNVKIPQIGGVHIEDNVEIGANTTVDRATIGYTRIGENTKIDNLVHIGHNVTIGKNCIICAMCGISGSVKIGNNVIIAGAVGLKDHIEIEDNVYIGAKAGVMERRVRKGSRLLGIPAIDFRSEMEFIALKPKIKDMYRDIKAIKKKLGL